MKSKRPSPRGSIKRTVKVVEFCDGPIEVIGDDLSESHTPKLEKLEKMVDDIAKKLQNSEDEIIAINVSSDSLERDIQKNIENLIK